ncbi:hypothetical protein C0993_001025 [Termitomyces sp. T159_Od127]|nr:hypothetical protein C0993_001025 [Termitomyces sp. T159_Od127]
MKKQINPKFLAFILLHSLPNNNIWETFRATILNSLAPEKVMSFSELADWLTFTAAAQQGASVDAALKAETSSKQKMKAKSDMWCNYHKANSHNMADCWTLKKQKDGKKRKGKNKPKTKANRASHNLDSDHKSSDESDGDADSRIAGYLNTESAHVSKALMTCILAYTGSASKELTNLNMIADSGASPT